jgi:hypothetical protein
LNGGDAGLKRFFERVHKALVPGGTFVLEAQPRESYIKARKLHPVRYLRSRDSSLSDANSCNVDSAGERTDIADTARGV